MSEQDHVDRWLREAMAADEPRLSSSFEARLARRLKPARLTPTARLVLLAYIVAAVAVSVLALRTVALDSRIVVATMVGTLAATAAYRPAVRRDGEVKRDSIIGTCDVHDLSAARRRRSPGSTRTPRRRSCRESGRRWVRPNPVFAKAVAVDRRDVGPGLTIGSLAQEHRRPAGQRIRPDVQRVDAGATGRIEIRRPPPSRNGCGTSCATRAVDHDLRAGVAAAFRGEHDADVLSRHGLGAIPADEHEVIPADEADPRRPGEPAGRGARLRPHG